MRNVSITVRRGFVASVFFLAFTSILLSGFAARAASVSGNDTIAIAAADVLSDADMAVKRASGGTTVSVSSNQVINATSTGNTMDVKGNLTNGNIYTGNSFGGSGFGSYVMNTGNNSTINSGVSLRACS